MQPKGLLKFLKLEGLLQNITEYIENRIAIVKLDLKSKVGDMVRSAMVYLPIAVLGLFALTFLSLALAQAINVWLESRVWGFLIVGVLYLVVCGVLYSMRNSDWLKKKIVDGSTSFLKEKPADQKDENNIPPAGYHAEQVEHKKFIFEEPAPTVDADITTASSTGGAVIIDDEELKAAKETTVASHSPSDREPVTNTAPPRTSYSPASVKDESEKNRSL